MQKEDWDRALADLTEALRRDPRMPGYNRRGSPSPREASRWTRRSPISIRRSGSIRRASTTTTTAAYALLGSRARPEPALADFKQALAINPQKSGQAQQPRPRLRQKGQHDIAIPDWRRGLRLHSDRIASRRSTAASRIARRRFSTARWPISRRRQAPPRAGPIPHSTSASSGARRPSWIRRSPSSTWRCASRRIPSDTLRIAAWPTRERRLRAGAPPTTGRAIAAPPNICAHRPLAGDGARAPRALRAATSHACADARRPTKPTSRQRARAAASR